MKLEGFICWILRLLLKSNFTKFKIIQWNPFAIYWIFVITPQRQIESSRLLKNLNRKFKSFEKFGKTSKSSTLVRICFWYLLRKFYNLRIYSLQFLTCWRNIIASFVELGNIFVGSSFLSYWNENSLEHIRIHWIIDVTSFVNPGRYFKICPIFLEWYKF